MAIKSNHAFSRTLRNQLRETFNNAQCVYKDIQDQVPALITLDNGEFDHILAREFAYLEKDMQAAIKNAGYPKTLWQNFAINSHVNCARVSASGNWLKGQQEKSLMVIKQDNAVIVHAMRYFARVWGLNGKRKIVLKSVANKTKHLAIKANEYEALSVRAVRLEHTKGDLDKFSMSHNWIKEGKEYKRQILKFGDETPEAKAHLKKMKQTIKEYMVY